MIFCMHEHVLASSSLVIADLLPSLPLQVCYYHFSQAIWQKAQNLGLASAYKDPQSDTNKFFRRVISLPFVAVWYVRMAWGGLVT